MRQVLIIKFVFYGGIFDSCNPSLREEMSALVLKLKNCYAANLFKNRLAQNCKKQNLLDYQH